MVYLTRRETFNAAHKLYVEAWSEEKNFEVFGKCANKNWHGHNYELYVTVKGELDPVTGFFINVKDLGRIIKKVVISKLDHKNLNLDVPYFAEGGPQATIENLAIWIWRELEPHLEGFSLHCVKVYETENIYAEYFGE